MYFIEIPKITKNQNRDLKHIYIMRTLTIEAFEIINLPITTKFRRKENLRTPC